MPKTSYFVVNKIPSEEFYKKGFVYHPHPDIKPDQECINLIHYIIEHENLPVKNKGNLTTIFFVPFQFFLGTDEFFTPNFFKKKEIC